LKYHYIDPEFESRSQFAKEIHEKNKIHKDEYPYVKNISYEGKCHESYNIGPHEPLCPEGFDLKF